jgi:ubiquinone/menaquinone biosynthesis C-methylase UbiE
VKLPEHSCVYNDFDPTTLRPRNRETAMRKVEIDLTKLEIAGKQVLDIGCNNGYLSLRCANGGASHITSMDVRDEYLSFLQEIVEARGLEARFNIVNANFRDISTIEYESDVVFFLEVIHWVTSQGETIQRSIRRLWEMTRETLVIEFPWSVNEPSIRVQTTLTAEDYDASIIFRALTHHFNVVQVLGFGEYFGGQNGSCRALVVAREPKTTPVLESYIPGIGRTERCIRPDKLWLSFAGETAYAVKRLPMDAKLRVVPTNVYRHVLMELTKCKTFSIPQFKQFDGDSIIFSSGEPRNEQYLVYSWIGASDLSELDQSYSHTTWPRVRETAIEVVHMFGSPAGAEIQGWIDRRGAAEYAELCKFAAEKNIDFVWPFDSREWSLGHGDVHQSNVIVVNGETHLLDIETLWVYPKGFDALWAMILCGIRDNSEILATIHLLAGSINWPTELHIIALTFAFERWRDLVLDGSSFDKDAFSNTEKSFELVTAMCRHRPI